MGSVAKFIISLLVPYAVDLAKFLYKKITLDNLRKKRKEQKQKEAEAYAKAKTEAEIEESFENLP